MIRYVGAAATLKFFSISPETKWAYRQFGNIFGQRIRLKHGLEKWRLPAAKKSLDIIEKHHIVRDGDRLLEIGTGWVHWEATVIRLFYDVEITLFDTWDNRQLEAYKRYFRMFGETMDRELALEAGRSKRAHRLLEIIANANSFEEIYKAFGFRYVLDSNGTLKQFQDESFSVIFSICVFEHLHKAILPEFIRDIHRLLKPGGYSIHGIDISDHLIYYDPRVSRKEYLRYSDKVWRRFFENDVQYFNRVQRPEWLELFRKAGLELVEEIPDLIDIESIKINKDYEHLEKSDLRCEGLRLIHKKSD